MFKISQSYSVIAIKVIVDDPKVSVGNFQRIYFE